MRSLTRTAVLVGMLVAACGGPARPEAMRPTLDALTGAGFECNGGQADNVPSGLTGWHCEGTLDGERTIVELTGSTAGAADITISTQSPDAAALKERFGGLIGQLPPFSANPGVATALEGWDGSATRLPADAPVVSVDCSSTQCNASVAMPRS